MTFAQLENRLLRLRARMSTALGKDHIGELTVSKPDGQHDELSFLRIVVWSYALLHENGRVILRFINDLPAVAPHKVVLPHIAALRTWLAHNLSFDKARDVKTLQVAEAWLLRACGTGSPQTSEHWTACSARLIGELSDSLDGALKACDFFLTEQDGPRLVEQLKRRVERDWAAHKFDEFAELACRRLGYVEIDVPKFRGRHLDAWRKVVDMATDETIDALLRRRIEADLLSFMNNALPVSADLFDEVLGSAEAEALAAAMIVLRTRVPNTAKGPSAYISAVISTLKDLNSKLSTSEVIPKD